MSNAMDRALEQVARAIPATPLQQAKRERDAAEADRRATARQRSGDLVDVLAQAMAADDHVCNPPRGQGFRLGQQWRCPCGRFHRSDGRRFRPESEARTGNGSH